MPTISASILAANHANLERDVFELEGEVDWIHVDIMDVHFVNNFSFGPKTVEDLRKITTLPIDVHLQMYNPELVMESFIHAGANMIMIQYESCRHPLRTIQQIKEKGCQVSMSFAPTTSFEQIKYFIPYVDQISILTVESGLGGQILRKEVLPKIKSAYHEITDEQLSTIITVDGGVNAGSIAEILRFGANNLVIGTMLFANGPIKNNIEEVKSFFTSYDSSCI